MAFGNSIRKRLGTELVHSLIVEIIRKHGYATNADLRKELKISRQMVERHTARLERAGLIQAPIRGVRNGGRFKIWRAI